MYGRSKAENSIIITPSTATVTSFEITLLISELYCNVRENEQAIKTLNVALVIPHILNSQFFRMSKPIHDDCFGMSGVLTDAIVKEHIVPSLGVGAADTIWKAGWDGESAALSVGLAIDGTGEHIRAAKAFGVGFYDNSWTISTTKLWGSQNSIGRNTIVGRVHLT